MHGLSPSQNKFQNSSRTFLNFFQDISSTEKYFVISQGVWEPCVISIFYSSEVGENVRGRGSIYSWCHHQLLAAQKEKGNENHIKRSQHSITEFLVKKRNKLKKSCKVSLLAANKSFHTMKFSLQQRLVHIFKSSDPSSYTHMCIYIITSKYSILLSQS